MKNIMSELWEHVENDQTSKGRRVHAFLNKDRINAVLLDKGVFWIEGRTGWSIPNYVYKYIIKWGEEKGYKYYMEKELEL